MELRTEPAARSAASAPRAGAVVLVVLLALSVAGFAVTRGVRLRDDVVNTVRLTPGIGPGETARIRFRTTVADSRADVLITDLEDRQVRALQLGAPLAGGPHTFSWDGTGDDGERVPPGRYGIRVILAEHGRDIKPPGRIRVTGPDGAGG